MGGSVQTPVGSTKVPLALHFGATDIADANGTFVSVQAGVNEYTMPVGGSVIGFGVKADGTLTDGTMSFTPTVNGVATLTYFADTMMTSEKEAHGIEPSREINFVAGDSVGLAWTKAGTVAPTTLDASAVLIVLLDGYHY